MSSPLVPGAAPTAPLRGELRYGFELARLLADAAFLRPARSACTGAVLLVRGSRVVLIGQSRGGELARVVAARNADTVSTLVMLGAPVLGPLDVGPSVVGAVRSVARLGDLGVPRMFSTECGNGACCADYRADMVRPLPESTRAVAIYSRSDGIVSWRSCPDPYAEHVEVNSSHSGMSVNAQVYRLLAQILDEEAERWTG